MMKLKFNKIDYLWMTFVLVFVIAMLSKAIYPVGIIILTVNISFLFVIVGRLQYTLQSEVYHQEVNPKANEVHNDGNL